MLKNFVSICAALILATAAFGGAVQARGGGGTHFSGGGAHFGGARVGGTHFGGAGLASGSYAYRGAARGHAYPGAAHGFRYGYRHGGYYGGYWPYWGWAAWPYYDDYGYAYEAPTYDGDVAYCVRRFRSYDPVSRTYLGYDGHRHSCP